MKTSILNILPFLLIGLGATAQNVNIPDANFKAYLVGSSFINPNSDSEIQVSEAEAITYLNLNSKNIADLTGIEAFINLVTLTVSDNQLTTIDVSQNTLLSGLVVSNNLLTSIDVSQNTVLSGLGCGYNNISTLDVTQNTDLIGLLCEANNISFLDLSQNTALIQLNCKQNNISTLDLSNTSINQNTTLEIPYINCEQNDLTVLKMNNISTTTLEGQYFLATSNPNLTCIEVDDVAAATAAWTNIDAASSFSTDCALLSGIDDLTLQTSLKLYPNPVVSELNITTDEKIVSISIINIAGQVILNFSTPANTIDVSDLAKGVYNIQITTETGLINKTIIKE